MLNKNFTLQISEQLRREGKVWLLPALGTIAFVSSLTFFQ
jgi:hypothetical protein